ncbi:MAG: DUF4339 domain-containing protein [Armatimonadetes bacterium]|nr:DUF4339 domain-containing protein [Armatimonadota bacterium]
MNERFEWYYLGSSGQMGPMSEEQLLELADSAVLTRDTMVWKVGMEAWTAAGSVPRLAERLRPVWTPPPPPQNVPGHGAPPGPGRSRTCPVDGTALRRVQRTGIDIDTCPACRGVWLDHGELEKLIDREDDGYGRSRDDDDDDGWKTGRRDGKRKKNLFGEVFDIFD